ncbi:hypothetical protein [Hymenobacter lucidus]|uniref:hypothetical protein n=1 Tax=Hymenobacter lucidus TaxID=2880930 RepID=UPI001CF496EF|nr:hypothetical protein [Hymenobacter lucidus]
MSYLDLSSPPEQYALQPDGPWSGPSEPAGAVLVQHGCYPVDILRFGLHQAPDNASVLHLALFCRERQVVRWVLPSAALFGPALRAPTYLVEAPDSLPLPARAIDGGNCLLRSAPADQVAFLEQDIQTGHLRLTLRGRWLHGPFSLARVHPQSQTWELEGLHCLPPQRMHARA